MSGRANEKSEEKKEKEHSGAGKKLISQEEREGTHPTAMLPLLNDIIFAPTLAPLITLFTVGSVGFGVYRNYMLALGGIWILGLLLTGYMVDQSTRVGSDWWLSVWADENFKNANDTSGGSANATSTRYYLGIYLAWVRPFSIKTIFLQYYRIAVLRLTKWYRARQIVCLSSVARSSWRGQAWRPLACYTTTC